jgi:hypothetical protein
MVGRRDMKKISSVISLSFLVLFLLVSCEKSSSDNTNKSSTNNVTQSSPQQSLEGWVEYYKNPEGNVLLYKKVNIQKDKSNYIVQVWVKRVFSDVGKKKYIERTKKGGIWTEELDKISHIVGLYEIDCKKRMYRQTSVVIYDTDGENIGSLSNDEPKWTSIVSGSEMDSLLKEVCK